MKKLLICVSLLLVLVFAVVACRTNSGKNEDTTVKSDVTTESDTTVKGGDDTTVKEDDDTSVKEEKDTTVEENDDTSSAKEEDTTEEDTTEEPTKDPDEPVIMYKAEDIKNLIDNPVGNGNGNIKTDSVAVTDNYITVVASGNDPSFHFNMSGSNILDGARFVVVKYRTTVKANMEFFIASTVTYDPENGHADIPLLNDNEWHLMIVDLDTFSAVTDYKISTFRLDFLQQSTAEDVIKDGDAMDIQFVAFFNSEEAAKKYSSKTDAPYHTSVDYVNGTGPDNGHYSGRGGSSISGVDTIEDVNAPLANNTITIEGWFACLGGVEKYVWSVDGANWFDCTGEISKGDHIYNHASANIAHLAGCDETLANNCCFKNLAADLSEYEGQTVSVTFAAVPANAKDKVIPFVTIKDVVVPKTLHTAERGEYQKTSTVNMNNSNNKGGPFVPNDINAGHTFGYKFTVADDKWLNSIIVVDMATYDDPNTTGIFKLYMWDTDYATTIAGTPVFEKTIENHPNCATLTVDVSELNIKGGTFLWVAQCTAGKSGAGWTPWIATDGSADGCQAFFNGNNHDGFRATITVAEDANAPTLPEGCVFAATAEDIYNAANGTNGKNNTNITISDDKSYVTVTSTGDDPWIMAVAPGANQKLDNALYVIVVRGAAGDKSYNIFSGSGAGPTAEDQSATLKYDSEYPADKWQPLGIGGQHGGYPNGMNYFRYDFYTGNDGSMDIMGVYFFGSNVDAFNAFCNQVKAM